METRKDSLSVLKLCRFCLSQDEPLTSLYAKPKVRRDNINFSLKILSCISIEVFPSEKMLTYICNRCRTFMELFYEFKQICRMSDENILRYVRNGTPLESVEWHPLLVKTFQCAARQLSKLIDVESTGDDSNILMTSQDNSDSDNEDDEEVYNIKIGDGSDEGSKDRISCIKVMNIDESQDAKKVKNEDGATGRSKSGSKLGCFPCESCDRTYPLQQLLDLHMAKMHRTRNVQCEECDAKFFSKYDLQAHEICHSDEMPYQCAACGKKFKRPILLKRHEKLMHSELPQQRCPHCPATFLSGEELESHQQKHRPYIKPFICDICDKKFHTRASLQRHKSLVHECTLPFVCHYCPMNFSTVSKLTSHLRSHAGARLFPCKFCKKNFVKSHHYARHLRIKHREEMGQTEETQSEQFRCEQCSESFASQDDLIYHSAIHATQNLTCPLCQERFPNVDAVTAHVKSHGTGMEYMCELCELVFTSQQKLNNHVVTAHKDEFEQEPDEDESSMDVNDEEDEDDNEIQIKEEDGQMVVEINKADNFIIQGDDDEKTLLEDGEMEVEMTQVETQKPATAVSSVAIVNDTDKNQTAAILKKAEEIKRKAQQNLPESVPAKKMIVAKVENNNTGGASDKSLRLLEKELQDLKRTNSRPNDTSKIISKVLDTPITKPRRLPLNVTKSRVVEEKKLQIPVKPLTLEKKQQPRVLTKENKEPKEKDTKISEEKEPKEKEPSKEKESSKGVMKNGANDKASNEEGIVRRSSRPSKIKDYAKLLRESSQEDDEDSMDYSDDNEDQYKEIEKSPEGKVKGRRLSNPKGVPKTQPPPLATPRKRGRPRKDQSKEIPNKIVKENDKKEVERETPKKADSKPEEPPSEAKPKDEEKPKDPETPPMGTKTSSPSSGTKPASEGLLMSPTGQTLKKVPIRSLPPGIRPLPLPMNARPLGSELCEMQIGKRVVKVQKIVMTKADVEAMAKKGLVEMKDGTMVLKQGIKLPTTDMLKTSLVGEVAAKESPINSQPAAPTRCDIEEDS